jgi:hypothetical protein
VIVDGRTAGEIKPIFGKAKIYSAASLQLLGWSFHGLRAEERMTPDLVLESEGHSPNRIEAKPSSTKRRFAQSNPVAVLEDEPFANQTIES